MRDNWPDPFEYGSRYNELLCELRVEPTLLKPMNPDLPTSEYVKALDRDGVIIIRQAIQPSDIQAFNDIASSFFYPLESPPPPPRI